MGGWGFPSGAATEGPDCGPAVPDPLSDDDMSARHLLLLGLRVMDPHGPQYHALISRPSSRREGAVRRFYRRLRRRYRERIVRNHVAILRRCIAELDAEAVLEIGSGSGRVLGDLLRRCESSIAIEGIDLPAAHSVRAPGLPVRAMDACRLNYPDCSFDLVFSLHTAEHLENLRAVLTEITRVLRPGGHLLLMVPIELFRGSHAYMESLSITGNPLRALKMARELHVRTVGPVAEYDLPAGRLRLASRKRIFRRVLSPEWKLLYEKAPADDAAS